VTDRETETRSERQVREAAEEGRGTGRTPYEQELADEDQAQAVAEIPNPGPIDEPEPQHQAHHTEQTDPPEGPYPDPPQGPYPDPAIKDPPTEEQVFSHGRSTTTTARGTERTEHAKAPDTTHSASHGAARPAAH